MFGRKLIVWYIPIMVAMSIAALGASAFWYSRGMQYMPIVLFLAIGSTIPTIWLELDRKSKLTSKMFAHILIPVSLVVFMGLAGLFSSSKNVVSDLGPMARRNASGVRGGRGRFGR